MATPDAHIYRHFQEHPIYFIEKMWGLKPQPVLLKFQSEVDRMIEEGNFQDIREEFFESFKKGEHITWQQWLILLMVERAIQGKGHKKISVVSGHGIGKSSTLSWLILWFLFCFADAQVPCTAPTTDLMHDVLWKEIKIWLDRMPEDISNLYDWSTGYVKIKESPQTWFARARTARKEAPEALQGIHADYVLIPIDEASGVFEEIFKAAEGSLTGENVFVLMISNGTRNEGYFYDSHHSFKHMWQHLHLDSSRSPIVNPDFVDGIINKYGMESDEYKIRVAGGFPNSEQMDEGGWVPLILESQITQISPEMAFLGKKYMGVDPAGEGDDLALWKVRDEFMERTVAKEQISTPKSIARITADLMEKLEIPDYRVVVDNLGEGANVARELALIKDKHYSVQAVNWAEKPEDEETYLNKRAECYFRLRKWLINGGAVTDDTTKKELAMIKYKNNRQGRKQIMDKKDMRRLMGKSPDRSDALALTFYEDGLISDRLQTTTTTTGGVGTRLHDPI